MNMKHVRFFAPDDFAQAANEVQINIAFGFDAMDFHPRIGDRAGNLCSQRTH